MALRTHFKGHMKILASTLRHKSPYPESHYQNSISNGIGLQKFPFSFAIFFGKNRTSVKDASQNSFFCLVIQY